MTGVVAAMATEVFRNERRELSSEVMVRSACRVGGTAGETGMSGSNGLNPARTQQHDAEFGFERILLYPRAAGIKRVCRTVAFDQCRSMNRSRVNALRTSVRCGGPPRSHLT